MRTIVVVGAGFSGLTLAYELVKAGFKVRVVEKQKYGGGLVGAGESPFGMVETGPNALLCNAQVEEMFRDLNVPFAERLEERKHRFIYWDGPKRWPLSLASTLKLAWTSGKMMWGRQDVQPEAGESVFDWARRTLGPETEERLVQPALQGIFAGDNRRLSAVLCLRALLRNRGGKPGKFKGSVAPADGMGQLIQGLLDFLENHSMPVEYGENFKLPEFITEPTVICASAWGAAEILKTHDPKLSELLNRCESIPKISMTAFFNRDERDLKGFGCLFPPSQGFRALGVLFNSSIFKGRSNQRSETWMFGGATKPDQITWTDDQLVEAMVKDRERLTGRYELPLGQEIWRWPRAIPYYTTRWEQALGELKAKPPLFLHGNYLGALGLARIYSRSQELAKTLKEMYG